MGYWKDCVYWRLPVAEMGYHMQVWLKVGTQESPGSMNQSPLAKSY